MAKSTTPVNLPLSLLTKVAAVMDPKHPTIDSTVEALVREALKYRKLPKRARRGLDKLAEIGVRKAE